MENEVPRSVLLKAVKIIRQWHDMGMKDDSAFKIYYEMAPEMKSIRETLGPYDKMKNEVISATSITANEP